MGFMCLSVMDAAITGLTLICYGGGETNSMGILLLIAREKGFCTGNLKQELFKCQN